MMHGDNQSGGNQSGGNQSGGNQPEWFMDRDIGKQAMGYRT
tara:strand:+ start:5188 stop:5310 length:123 start_codon:yes stop_codon:yes gene_type:complete